MSQRSRDLTEQALARIAAPDGEGARSCLTVYAEAARAAADAADARARAGQSLGPLDGVVITIKDLFDVAGEVTRAGSAVLARTAAAASDDAPTVARLRAAGAVIVAKTNMTEFAFSGVGLNPHYGTPGNPNDRTRIPGGSSSGGAVACADGIGEIAIGTDTGGSTRIPAALCGLVGWKPTARRVSNEGVHPLSPSLDSVGCMAHSVAACALADAVLAADSCEPVVPASLSGLRIGLLSGVVLTELDAHVAQRWQALVSRLSRAVRCEDVQVDALSVMEAVNGRGGIAPPEAYALHRDLLAAHGDGVDPFVRSRMQGGAARSAEDVRECLAERARGCELFERVFDTYDVLALPTTAIVAPTFDELRDEARLAAKNRLLLRNTSIANFFDLCAVSLPLQDGHALPCGLMLFGKHGADRALLQRAAAIEGVLNGGRAPRSLRSGVPRPPL